MGKAFLTLVLSSLLYVGAAGQTRNSFAIVVDSESYRHCRTELESYRDAVRDQGLDAFILENEWSSPDEIRDTLEYFYDNRHLEGAVFVGDIPVPMLRKAQHLASAFKMDEKRFPMRESSIPSDRFYDDFDLKFRFVGRDTAETRFFYYNLSPDSPQYIECDIYSARIQPSDRFGDRYGELSAYLKKAVRVKKEMNGIDRIMSYTGDGSFSNSLIAWKDESVTISEQFPGTCGDSDGAKFYVFAMYPDMKGILIREIQRNDLDVAIFHEHGMPDRQYLTGIPDRSDYSNYLDEGYRLGKYYAREAYRSAVRRGKTSSEAAASITERYGIDSTWFCNAFDPDIESADSLTDLESGIILEDIQAAQPNVRLAIFDACYNGDFRENDCIASRYIMSGGNTVVAVGNSANVLQDKSSADLMGMLAAGYSVGEWMQQTNIIESHIMGDPTFRFSPSYSFTRPDLRNKDCSYWLEYIDDRYPCDIQGLALHKLYSLGYPELPSLLTDIFDSSDYYMLRLQCMHLLAHYRGGAYTELLVKAMDDPYEFIRRKAAYFSGLVGADELVQPLTDMYMKDYNSLRVAFNIMSGGSKFPDRKFLKELEREVMASAYIYDRQSFLSDAANRLDPLYRMEEGAEEALSGGGDSFKSLYISSMRNNPYPHLAEACLKTVMDSSEDEDIRLAVAEVLGWYVYSYNREEIAERLEEYLSSGENMPDNVRAEIRKTVGRLSDYLRDGTETEDKGEKVFIPCSKKTSTSFAIITDPVTWSRCSEEFKAYRDVLEEEGLGTYIIADAWDDPMELRNMIKSLANRKPVLEGVVLAGAIPVAMIREAQHLTTAFKMDEERYPEFESSVASDRFYDDFDLDFEFTGRDSTRNDVFYYRLSEKGAQTLHPDIYSARMKVPGVMPGDKYEILRTYLRKTVAAHREQNCLDRMNYFAGHGYNSDCLTVWRQKPLVFRENFPYCFEKASGSRFLNFREDRYMQDKLFNEIQREGVDFFMFSEHGEFDTQYINSSEKEIGTLDDAVSRLKNWIASNYEKYRGTDEEEAFKKEVLDSVFHISRRAVSDSAMAEFQKFSAENNEKINITQDEILRLRSNARVIVFNACYNGSFHRNDGYIAGCHVFGPGECVVAQGNTVNVLQDKWEDKLIGLISKGERIGMWQKEIPYLESHLIGDPTFRFTPHSEEEAETVKKLHNDLIFNGNKPKIWARYIQSSDPVLVSAGITHLAYADPAEAEKEAFRLFCSDSSWTVRMHALDVLVKTGSQRLTEAAAAGLDDSYEMIVRTCCHIAGDICDSTLVPVLEKTVECHPEMVRVSGIAAGNALETISGHKLARYTVIASDKTLPEAKRRSAVRMFRNSNILDAIPVLVGIVCDGSESESLRRDACEALGWYNLSCKREDIISSLAEIREKGGLPQRVENEIEKTIKRLKY